MAGAGAGSGGAELRPEVQTRSGYRRLNSQIRVYGRSGPNRGYYDRIIVITPPAPRVSRPKSSRTAKDSGEYQSLPIVIPPGGPPAIARTAGLSRGQIGILLYVYPFLDA